MRRLPLRRDLAGLDKLLHGVDRRTAGASQWTHAARASSPCGNNPQFCFRRVVMRQRLARFTSDIAVPVTVGFVASSPLDYLPAILAGIGSSAHLSVILLPARRLTEPIIVHRASKRNTPRKGVVALSACEGPHRSLTRAAVSTYPGHCRPIHCPRQETWTVPLHTAAHATSNDHTGLERSKTMRHTTEGHGRKRSARGRDIGHVRASLKGACTPLAALYGARLTPQVTVGAEITVLLPCLRWHPIANRRPAALALDNTSLARFRAASAREAIGGPALWMALF